MTAQHSVSALQTLQNSIQAGTTCLSLEFFGPHRPASIATVQLDMQSAIEAAAPDFITVTCKAGVPITDTTLAVLQLEGVSVPSVAHVTSFGRSRIELEEIAVSCSNKGVDILALSGDKPVNGTLEENTFSNSCEMAGFLREYGHTNLFGAAYPERHPHSVSPEVDIEVMQRKEDQGIQAFITQMVFDADVYLRFVERAEKAGVNSPILPGIVPMRGVEQVTRIATRCDVDLPDDLLKRLQVTQTDEPSQGEDALKRGTELTIDLGKKLQNGGAPGLHLFTFNAQTSPGTISTLAQAFR